jgi:hypothetical protein
MYESAIQFEADLSFMFLVSNLFLLPVRNYRVRGIHIGVRTLQVIQLIWLGYIARPSRWEGGGLFTCSNDDYLPSRRI